MSGFRNVADLADAELAGGYHYALFFKGFTSTMPALYWNDLTTTGSIPRASYYVGDDLTFTRMPAGNHLSIYSGGDVSPATKVLKSFSIIQTSSANLRPCKFVLCDYLGYYPLISAETTGTQVFDNTVEIPRYADGAGVRAFVVQIFGANAGARYSISYVNQDGITKTTPEVDAAFGGTGTLQHGYRFVNNAYRPFLDLAAGDSGMRRVNSLTCSVVGAGVMALVLVKPIAEAYYLDTSSTTPAEIKQFETRQALPVIEDGAFLGMLATFPSAPSGLNAFGACEFVWG